MLIEQIIQEIDKETRKEIVGHSEFQIRNFIINQPTPYGKYKQCILELRSRSKTYKTIKPELDRLVLLENKTEADIKKIADYEIMLEDLERETRIFYDIFNDVKQYINFEDRDKLESEYWNSKFEKELLAYWTAGHPIPPNLIQTIWSLPKECPVVQKMMNYLLEVQGNNARIESNINNKENRDLPILTR